MRDKDIPPQAKIAAINSILDRGLGSTPMAEALDTVHARFRRELEAATYYAIPALFLLSDGMPNRGTDRAVLEKAAAIRTLGTQ
jgi:Mg-chelatase subunit ChlD